MKQSIPLYGGNENLDSTEKMKEIPPSDKSVRKMFQSVFRSVITVMGSFLLIFTASLCTVGALVSGFSFVVDSRTLFITLLITAFVTTVTASFWRGKGLISALIPAVALICYNWKSISFGAKSVLAFVTSEFSNWLNIPELFRGSIATSYEITIFFAAFGGILAFLLAIAICMKRSTFLTVIMTIPFIFLTFLIIEFEPNLWFLFGVLAVYLTVLISSSAFHDDYAKRGLVVFPALLAALTLIGAAYLVAPPESGGRADTLAVIDDQLRNLAQLSGIMRERHGIGWPSADYMKWSFNIKAVEISKAGPRSITDTPLLEINASSQGTYYMRGFSMQLFNGSSWERDDTDYDQQPDDDLLMIVIPSGTQRDDQIDRRLRLPTRQRTSEIRAKPIQSIQAKIAEDYYSQYQNESAVNTSIRVIKTGDRTPVLYLPYYSYAYSINGEYMLFWHVSESILGLYNRLQADGFRSQNQTQNEAAELKSLAPYYMVDEITAETLRMLAVEAGINLDGDRSVVVDAVAAYIMSSARYSLTPYIIPEGEDFSLYFLQTLKQGYCIHFATAATLMLRSLGIPARYASGFVVSVSEDNVGENIVVTDRNAHAWVEVFYDNIGWVPLEVTPPSTNAEIPRRTSHAAIPEQDIESLYERDQTEYADETLTDMQTSQALENSNIANENTDQAKSNSTKRLIIVLIVIILPICGFIVRRKILKKIRETAFSQQDMNASVIFAWRYIKSINKRKSIPDSIEGIALKARFSLHTISEKERNDVVVFAKELSEEENNKKNIYGRIWFRYIRGL